MNRAEPKSQSFLNDPFGIPPLQFRCSVNDPLDTIELLILATQLL